MKKANSFIFLICSILLICSLTSCKAKQEDVSSVNTMSEQEESEPGNSVSEQTKGDMTSFSASTLSGGTFTQEDLAIGLENTAVVLAPLVPWSIAGAVPLATLGAPTAALAAACYLYLIPLWDLAVHLGKRRLTAKAR